MAWLCIFHAQGIAQDCISHGGLAAVQGVKCLIWKTPSRFPRMALLGRGDTGCDWTPSLQKSVQALFCCFVWLCVSVCLCVKVLLVTNLGYYLKLWGWGGISFLNLVESLVGSMSLRLSVELKWNQGVYSWQKFICFFLEKGVREGVKNRALWMLKILVKPVFNDTSVN